MWNARPLELCRDEDLMSYQKMLEQLKSAGCDLPLSQSLSWANAAQVCGQKTWIIFNQEELIGGIVFVVESEEGLIAECINGPCLTESLYFEDPATIATAYARFVNVISKTIKSLSSIILRPRTSVPLPENFPFPIEEEQRAATWVISLPAHTSGPALSKRLERTVRHSTSNIISQKIFSPDHSSLRQFYKGQEAFFQHKELPIPPWEWWKALVLPEKKIATDLIFWIEETILSSANAKSHARLLLADFAGKRTYLFGHEARDEGFPSKLSSQALAQIHAITHAQELSLQIYDFNGYHLQSTEQDSYYGVNQFKEQFLGSMKPYFIPTLIFEI